MALSKKKAWKHLKKRCGDSLCGFCLRRRWLGLKWGKYLDDERKKEGYGTI